MNKIDSSSITERIYRRLLEAIVNREIRPGEKLTEETVSADLGVSRTPVREAFARLINEGFVIFKPRTGRFVKKFTRKEIDDIFELRCFLEVQALRLAFDAIPKRAVNELLDLLERCDGVGRDELAELSIQIDDGLHDLIRSHCGNEYLKEDLDRLITLTLPYRGLVARDSRRLKQRNRERRGVLAAIQSGDVERACERLAEHVRGGKEWVLREWRDDDDVQPA